MSSKFIYILFSIGLIATIDYNGLNNPRAKLVAMGCFAFLFVLALIRKKNRRENSPNRAIFGNWIKWFVIACAVNVFYYFLFDRDVDVLNQEIALPLMVTFASYTLFDLDEDKQPLFFLLIATFSAFFGFVTITTGLGGFNIVANSGGTELAKNQIGAAYTTVAIIAAVFAMGKNIKLFYRLSFGMLSIFNLYPAIYFGCRTAQLCYCIVVLFLLYEEYGKKAIFLIPVLFIIVFILGGSTLQTTIYEAFIGGRDITDADDLTSNRVTQFWDSFYYFLEHPFLGFYGSGDSYAVMPGNAHMFVMLHLAKWGIIGSIPFLALYFNIFKILLDSIKKKQILLSGTLFLAFTESLAEYAPPFGPGSCFLIIFFIIGIYLKKYEIGR